MKIVTHTLAVLALLLICTEISAQDKTAASLYNEGLALLKSKDYPGGLALMERALAAAKPEDEKVVALAKKNGAVAAYNAANTLRKTGSNDEAIALYQKGMELNPSNSANYEGVARALEAKGDKAGAIKSYLEAASKATAEGKSDKAAKRTKKAQNMVAKLYVGKDYDQAIACAEAFNGIKNDNAEVHYYLGKAYAEKGDTDKAVMHTSEAVKLAGDAAADKHYYAKASALEKSGNKADAIAAYQKITGEKYKAQAEYRISELNK